MPKNLAKSALGISDEWKTILFFGAIRDNKGLANILHAMPLIKEKNRKVKLLIIGEPYENYKRYRKIINDKEIEENVYEKLEYVENEDIAKYFFATDVVVLPYNEITQSGVLQVAYAFGKPVIATDLPGFREAINQGENGYLFAPGDIRSLADRAIDLLLDEKKAEEMGRMSRSLAEKKYDWDTIADKTIELYRSA